MVWDVSLFCGRVLVGVSSLAIILLRKSELIEAVCVCDSSLCCHGLLSVVVALLRDIHLLLDTIYMITNPYKPVTLFLWNIDKQCSRRVIIVPMKQKKIKKIL